MLQPPRLLFKLALCMAVFAIVVNAYAITLDLLHGSWHAAGQQSLAAIFATFALWAAVSVDEWRQHVMTAIETDVEFKRTMLDKLKQSTVHLAVDDDDDDELRH